jgi:hypothetical protein
MHRALVVVALLTVAAPLAAKDSLGVFDDWAAFRDPAVPRCYAITASERERTSSPYQAYADVGTWPRQGVRGQIHFRTSREMARNSHTSLFLGGKRYDLVGGGADAWAKDERTEAAILTALRSANEMSISAIDDGGHRFTDRYSLRGAPTAMDAATVGCARVR